MAGSVNARLQLPGRPMWISAVQRVDGLRERFKSTHCSPTPLSSQVTGLH